MSFEEDLRDFYWKYDLGMGISEEGFINALSDEYLDKARVKEIINDFQSVESRVGKQILQSLKEELNLGDEE